MSSWRSLLVGVLALVLLVPAPGQAQEKAIHWRVSSPVSPGHVVIHGLKMFAEKLQKETGGRIQLSVHAAGELGIAGGDHFAAVRDATVEVADAIGIYATGQDMFFNWSQMPYLAQTIEDAKIQYDAVRPYLATVLEKRWNSKLLMLHPFPPQVMYTNKPINSLADMKGMKMRAYGLAMPEMYKRLGVVPVSMPILDFPIALQRGTVDGGITSATSGAEISVWEGACCGYENMGIWFPDDLTIINLGVWNKLPKDLQDKVLRAAREVDDWLWARPMEEHQERLQVLKAKGLKVQPFPDGWKKELAALMADYWDKWAERVAADGGKEYLQTVRRKLGR
jgi:TRAP-type transport system periplasmic protein